MVDLIPLPQAQRLAQMLDKLEAQGVTPTIVREGAAVRLLSPKVTYQVDPDGDIFVLEIRPQGE